MIKNTSITQTISRLILALVFLLSAFGKIAEFNGFALFIEKILLMSDTASLFVASLIIGIEFFIGSFLLLKYFVRESLIIALIVISSLFVPFTVYAIITDINVDCGCFGAIEILNIKNNIVNLIKNIILIGLVLCAWKKRGSDVYNFKPILFYLTLFVVFIFSYNYNFYSEGLSLVEKVKIEDYIENKSKYFIIDARDHSVYLEGHIPNSISIPYKGNATDLTEVKNLLINNSNRKIITYCDAASCALAKLMALKISSEFKIPTYELIGGIEEWRNHKQ